MSPKNQLKWSFPASSPLMHFIFPHNHPLFGASYAEQNPQGKNVTKVHPKFTRAFKVAAEPHSPSNCPSTSAQWEHTECANKTLSGFHPRKSVTLRDSARLHMSYTSAEQKNTSLSIMKVLSSITHTEIAFKNRTLTAWIDRRRNCTKKNHCFQWRCLNEH